MTRSDRWDFISINHTNHAPSKNRQCRSEVKPAGNGPNTHLISQTRQSVLNDDEASKRKQKPGIYDSAIRETVTDQEMELHSSSDDEHRSSGIEDERTELTFRSQVAIAPKKGLELIQAVKMYWQDFQRSQCSESVVAGPVSQAYDEHLSIVLPKEDSAWDPFSMTAPIIEIDTIVRMRDAKHGWCVRVI